jgi:hypothetical protein
MDNDHCLICGHHTVAGIFCHLCMEEGTERVQAIQDYITKSSGVSTITVHRKFRFPLSFIKGLIENGILKLDIKEIESLEQLLQEQKKMEQKINPSSPTDGKKPSHFHHPIKHEK